MPLAGARGPLARSCAFAAGLAITGFFGAASGAMSEANVNIPSSEGDEVWPKQGTAAAVASTAAIREERITKETPWNITYHGTIAKA